VGDQRATPAGSDCWSRGGVDATGMRVLTRAGRAGRPGRFPLLEVVVTVAKAPDPDRRRLVPGTQVEVKTRFDGRWTTGFEIAAADDDDRYMLRRRSDGTLLPATFSTRQLRRRP